WSFFPNPAFQTLQIDIPDQKRGNLALYDLTGRLCATWAEIEDETAIQLGALPPGLYVLTLTDSQGRQSSQKLLVVQ
ncbi:MAG: T9SS type A sorting domain-containing protein, partial [Saprospiraceae bacterium]|nr:T9SS type A sorting domain-containing protein [Saprospiraceae bacterium]